MMTDEELLSRFANQHDEPAFTELVRRRIDFVYAVALRQVGGDAHLAQDAAQEVFLDLARKARSVAAGPALVSWLYTATRFAAAKVRRRQTRWLNREQEALTMNTILSDGTDPEWETLRPVIDEAMHELGEQDRSALLLRYFENRPLAEVGTKLGLAENSARMRIDRALDKLRTRLAKRGIASTATALGSALAAQPATMAPVGLAVTVAGSSLASFGSGPAFAAGNSLLDFMTKTKAAVGVAAIASLLGLAGYFSARHRLESEIASADRQQTARLAELRAENLRLRKASRSAVPFAPPPDPGGLAVATPVSQARAAVDLIKGGLLGSVGWRSIPSDLREWLTELANVLGFDAAETTELIQTVEQAQARMLANTLAQATVERRPDEVVIRIPESAASRATYEQLLEAMARTLGPEKYACLVETGAMPALDAALDRLGLKASEITVSRRPNPGRPSMFYSYSRKVPKPDGSGMDQVAAGNGITRETIKTGLGVLEAIVPSDF